MAFAAIENRKHWIIRGMFNLNVPFLPTHIKSPFFKPSFFSSCVFILRYEFSSPFLLRWSLIFCDGEPNHNFMGWWIVYLGIWRALTISDEMVNSGCQKTYPHIGAIFGLSIQDIWGRSFRMTGYVQTTRGVICKIGKCYMQIIDYCHYA